MEYQSLYRRYRPRRFAEVKGQEHVVRTIQNAVREERVGHAYLLSGPRGTGKTTTARLLAKVLNCQNVADGEPCGECDSCTSIESGSSFDLHELDAASNNKVDDIRDLLAKVALGTPGRNKVYLLDEVHMLTSGAENALLKTLEEPPAHVTFVLATTEPHKVVPTIRSRTQHLELTLLSAEQITDLVTEISADAGLDVDDAMLEYVIRAGGGSARDTLSALDQVVAAGGVGAADNSTTDLLEALASGNAAKALTAVSDATNRGFDPRVIGENFIDALREVFLVAMGSEVPHLSESDLARAKHYAELLVPGMLTRALELVGTSLVEMRQAPDPRVDLEVALVKLTRTEADTSVEGLVSRIAKLEQAMASGVAPVAAAPAAAPVAAAAPAEQAPAGHSAASAAPPVPQTEAPAPVAPVAPASGASGPAAAARATLAAKLGRGGAAPTAPKVIEAPVDDGPPTPPPPLGETGPTPPPVAEAPTPPPAAAAEPDLAEPDPVEPLVEEPPPAESAPEPPPVEQVAEQAPEAEPPTPEPEAPLSHEPLAQVPVAEEPAPPAAPAAAGGSLPSPDEIAAVWKEGILGNVSGKARSRYGIAEIVSSDGPAVVVNLPNEPHRKRCEEVRGEVEASLATHFGRPVPLELVSGTSGGRVPDGSDVGSSPEPRPAPQRKPEPVELEDEVVDVSELSDAPTQDGSAIDKLTKAFPGAELVQDDE